jgi:hypothetical protein
MALKPFVGPWPLFSVSWSSYAVGRTPWTGDQPVARPLLPHMTAQTQNKRRQTSMPQVRFEPNWTKTVHTARLLWSAATNVTVANSCCSLRVLRRKDTNGKKIFFFKTSSEHIQWSGCRQLFTSVTKPRYTKLSSVLKRLGHLDINVVEARILCSFTKKFWIKTIDTLFTDVKLIFIVDIIK